MDFTIKESAITIHEVYLSFIEAGFSEWQALYLVGQMVRGVQGSAG